MCIENIKPSPFTKPQIFYKNFEAEGSSDNLRLFDWNSGRTEYHKPYVWDPAYKPDVHWPQKGFCAWVSKKSAESMNYQDLRPLGRPIWARIRVLPEDILGIGTAPWANNRKAVMVRAFEILDFEENSGAVERT